MQDLESALHLLIRSDITHTKLISDKKLKALKDWISVLAKYFPGRKHVRNYLKYLDFKLSSPQLTEITGNQWKIIADENTVKN
jgi:thiol oxidase